MVPGDSGLDVGEQLEVVQHHCIVILKPEIDFDHLKHFDGSKYEIQTFRSIYMLLCKSSVGP